jgi:dTDP-4-dehydrorhamnose 3,5-epimerase
MKKVSVVEITLKEDDRGWVAWPIQAQDLKDNCIRHIHVPCLTPGAIRGNHYHRHSIECTLVLNGPCRAVFEDNETGKREEVLVEGPAPVLFEIAPDVTHAFKNEGTAPVFLICYEKRAGDNDAPDQFKKQLL